MNEAQIRLMVFLGTLALMSGLEFLFPYRKAPFFSIRKLINLAFSLLNTVAIRLISATGLIAVSVYAQENSIGLWNVLEWHYSIEFMLSLLVFDLLIYTQHLVFHQVPLLWRLHRLHHTDLEYDTTTAVRFHPIEILLSFLIKALVILALGASALSIIVFEVILSSLALFSHSNIELPATFESLLRKIIITPKFHRIHHSVRVDETNSNYAFNLTLWDYVFKTYVAETKDSDQTMPIGIEKFRESKDQTLYRLLIQPFSR